MATSSPMQFFGFFLHSHVSVRTGGKLVRVTAMMMKMIKGQVIRVSDHSC